IAVALRWVIAGALRPVAQMTEQAAAWSEHDLDGRFDAGDPHDELTRLAATLDTLLDRVAASLRHEQSFSAELSHELRTPLSRIAAEAELALRRERSGDEYRRALQTILASVDQLTRTVDARVRAAQHEARLAHGTSDAYAAATAAVEACAALAADTHVDLRVEPPAAPARLGVDHDVAARILQPLLENACRYGNGDVRVSIGRAGSRVRFTVSDDGPGVSADEREHIFDPGVRGTAAANATDDGAGLGLALARRLARAASGDVPPPPTPAGASPSPCPLPDPPTYTRRQRGGVSDPLCRHDRKGASCLRRPRLRPTSWSVAPAGRGASPEGERSALPAVRRSRSRTRFAIVFPMR